jgi:importin-5
MCQGVNPGLREGAYRVFSGCPNLVMDLQTDAVLGVFQKGLQDAESVDVSPSSAISTFFDTYHV